MPEVLTLGETMAVMSPAEAGPLRYVHNFTLHMAGAESNLAIGMCKLGHSAGWLSRLGTDELGQYVLNAIRAEGVETKGVRFDPEHRTGLMVKQLSAGESSVFYYRENSAASHFLPDDLDEVLLKSASILHLTGITPVLSASCRDAVLKAAQLAKDSGVLLSFDPNIRRKLWKDVDYTKLMQDLLFMSDIALMGLDEAQSILSTDEPERITALLREKGVKYIAVKDGGKGAWVADEKDFFFIPPYPCRCIDPIGAGDAFNAGFLSGILEGCGLETCGKMGGLAGALATETVGDIEGYPSRAQLRARLENTAVTYR